MEFGLHLYRKGVITAEELVAALEVQLNNRVRIGQLALEEGILSARDIFDVLHAQRGSPKERFGELAIEMGRMTREDLMQLLKLQSDRRPPLGDILVWQGVLTKQQAEAELSDFRRDQSCRRHAATRTTVVRAPHRRTVAEPSYETVMAP